MIKNSLFLCLFLIPCLTQCMRDFEATQEDPDIKTHYSLKNGILTIKIVHKIGPHKDNEEVYMYIQKATNPAKFLPSRYIFEILAEFKKRRKEKLKKDLTLQSKL